MPEIPESPESPEPVEPAEPPEPPEPPEPADPPEPAAPAAPGARGRLLRAGLALGAGAPLIAAALEARRELAPEGIGTDDAHIFLRYAVNLAHGLGWVWNPGEPPVEGTTSPLWTALAAAATKWRFPPYDLLFDLSWLLVVAGLALWLTAALDARDGLRHPAADLGLGLLAGLAVGAFVCAHPSFAVWTAASQMDSGLWCAALLAAAATLVAQARPAAGRSAALAAAAAQVVLALARPEAMLVGPVLIAAAALGSGRPLRTWRAPLAAAAATQVALVTWRLATFGWPLPNTYYAKVGDDLGRRWSGGLDYLAAAVGHDPWTGALWALGGLVLLAVGAAAGLRTLRRPRRLQWLQGAVGGPAGAALAVAAAATLTGPVLALDEGGDYFPGFRTLVVFRPFAATLLTLAVIRPLLRFGRRRAWLAAALVVGAAAASSYLSDAPRWGRLLATARHQVDFDAARSGFETAARLNRMFAATARPPRVGVLAAGALPLAYRGPSRDLLGLNDAAMAHASRRRVGVHGHSAFNADAFFAAPPEIVLVGPPDCLGRPAERSERALAFRVALAHLDRDPRFRSRYRLVRLEGPGPEPASLCTYARRDWLAAGADGARWEPVADRPLFAHRPARESAFRGGRAPEALESGP